MGLVLLLVAAPLLQVLLVNRSPWGGPDLVTLAVVWLALARGPVWGCAAGLAAGLAADVTPPADGTVGRAALVLSVTGLLVGWWRERGPLLVAGAGAALGTVLQAAAAVALGDEPWPQALAGLPLVLAWTVPLGALAGAALARRRPAAVMRRV
ncbi:rod shape-determining protein MreD [Nonomuraea sp. NPDC050643]|uniref:rod shape-determining protein MreD n=1 Tax=Nonomuraea sp. NPDC050643 TaxID=3155660 RepID=UPI0033CA81FE